MRLSLLLAALLLSGAAHAAGADVVFAERSALLGADRKCGLFEPSLRAALDAATQQARGTLLRSGWTEARADTLGRNARAEGAQRACTDAVLLRAADGARAGFAGWSRLPAMRFAGGERTWIARRTRDPDGFLLRQDIGAPRAATFGLRQDATGAAGVVLVLPLGARENAPASAPIYYRDRARAPRSAADLPGRTRTGLVALAASRASATVAFAQARTVETTRAQQRLAVFTFRDDLLAALAALDPREAVEIDLGATRLYLEVGDLAAARAFLAASR